MIIYYRIIFMNFNKTNITSSNYDYLNHLNEIFLIN